uniref:SRP-alpha_N domain-containing protein n=1 Tax=Caenorhabditis tropicalis TaxID=1561998 RepID=A0A1I7UZ34_9PELO
MKEIRYSSHKNDENATAEEDNRFVESMRDQIGSLKGDLRSLQDSEDEDEEPEEQRVVKQTGGCSSMVKGLVVEKKLSTEDLTPLVEKMRDNLIRSPNEEGLRRRGQLFKEKGGATKKKTEADQPTSPKPKGNQARVWDLSGKASDVKTLDRSDNNNEMSEWNMNIQEILYGYEHTDFGDYSNVFDESVFDMHEASCSEECTDPLESSRENEKNCRTVETIDDLDDIGSTFEFGNAAVEFEDFYGLYLGYFEKEPTDSTVQGHPPNYEESVRF